MMTYCLGQVHLGIPLVGLIHWELLFLIYYHHSQNFFKNFAGKPASPETLDISSYREDSVQLSWRMPLMSAPISGYRIEKKESGKSRWELVDSVDSMETSYTVRSLRPGVKYSFRVLAENVAGVSQPRVMDSFWMHRKSPYSEWNVFKRIIGIITNSLLLRIIQNIR